jgi:hypothetical protein
MRRLVRLGVGGNGEGDEIAVEIRFDPRRVVSDQPNFFTRVDRMAEIKEWSSLS